MKITFLKIILVVIVFVVLIFVAFLFSPKSQAPLTENPAVSDYKNLTYTINNQPIKLVNGYSQIEVAPPSASKITTQFFGNEATGDLNGDGLPDVAFLLTQQTSGTGIFYYLAVALKTSEGYQPVDTIFLGDRIAPQTSQITGGSIMVNYADRNPGEPMTATPSVGVSRYFKLQNRVLVEQPTSAVFSSPINLGIGKQFLFEDGLTVYLKQINDSRCKPGVVCIWAGELSPVVTIFGGGVGNMVKEITLGTTNNKTENNDGYTFELKSATETTATIIVTKN